MAVEAIEDLMASGGDVLWLILLASVCLWSLISERMLFLKFTYPGLQRYWLEQWRGCNACNSRIAFHIRRGILSEAKISLERSMGVIKMLIAICPMLGLLGTVTGMIQVFDVMAVTGSGNARALASGISQATISTMAGMVIAIAGLYVQKLLEKVIHDRIHHLAHLLKH